mmetsp:Transcript_20081/g.31015  ORF Transcript_20081/g.31015 Transcript_20081/m.31015 type:complete len:130 (+) Transcript_20081:190-579(+)
MTNKQKHPTMLMTTQNTQKLLPFKFTILLLVVLLLHAHTFCHGMRFPAQHETTMDALWCVIYRHAKPSEQHLPSCDELAEKFAFPQTEPRRETTSCDDLFGKFAFPQTETCQLFYQDTTPSERHAPSGD